MGAGTGSANLMSCLNSPCSYCRNQESGNVILVLKIHLRLPSTFRIECTSLPWVLGSHCSAPSPPTTLWLRFHFSDSKKHQSSLFSYLPQAVPLFPIFAYLVPSFWSTIPPPFCLANSLPTFRKLKHHLFQEAFPESPSWLQNASHLFAPKFVLLQWSDLLLCLAPWLKRALGVSWVSLVFAWSPACHSCLHALCPSRQLCGSALCVAHGYHVQCVTLGLLLTEFLHNLPHHSLWSWALNGVTQ